MRYKPVWLFGSMVLTYSGREKSPIYHYSFLPFLFPFLFPLLLPSLPPLPHSLLRTFLYYLFSFLFDSGPNRDDLLMNQPSAVSGSRPGHSRALFCTCCSPGLLPSSINEGRARGGFFSGNFSCSSTRIRGGLGGWAPTTQDNTMT